MAKGAGRVIVDKTTPANSLAINAQGHTGNVIYDASGNPVSIVARDAAIPATPYGQLLFAKDAAVDTARALISTSDGRLQVSTAVAPPPNTTPVRISDVGNVAGPGSSDNEYLIPNGETLVLQRFTGGAQQDTATGSKVALFYDPNGNGVGMTRIRTGYVSGNNFEFSLDESYVGDGTAKIRMRRTRFSGGSLEIAGFWDGYY